MLTLEVKKNNRITPTSSAIWASSGVIIKTSKLTAKAICLMQLQLYWRKKTTLESEGFLTEKDMKKDIYQSRNQTVQIHRKRATNRISNNTKRCGQILRVQFLFYKTIPTAVKKTLCCQKTVRHTLLRKYTIFVLSVLHGQDLLWL